MKLNAIIALISAGAATVAVAAPVRLRGLLGINIPVLSGGDSTAWCNHEDQIVNVNAPVFGSRKRHDGYYGPRLGDGKTKTLLDLKLPLLSGGKSTQKCENGDLIDLELPILSGRGDKA